MTNLIKSNTSRKDVYGFSTKDENGIIQSFLLNKGDQPYNVHLDRGEYSLEGKEIFVDSFKLPGKIYKEKFSSQTVIDNGLTLAPDSFTRIRIV